MRTRKILSSGVQSMQDWEEWEKHEFFQFSGGSQNKYFSSEVK